MLYVYIAYGTDKSITGFLRLVVHRISLNALNVLCVSNQTDSDISIDTFDGHFMLFCVLGSVVHFTLFSFRVKS